MPAWLLAYLPGLRKALPYVLLSVALIGGYWWQARYHYHRGEAAVEARYAAALAEAAARQESTHNAYLLVAGSLQAKVAAIRNLPPPPPPETLVKEVIREVPVGGECRCPGFADDFGSVWNAVSRRAARSAEASSVPE